MKGKLLIFQKEKNSRCLKYTNQKLELFQQSSNCTMLKKLLALHSVLKLLKIDVTMRIQKF